MKRFKPANIVILLVVCITAVMVNAFLFQTPAAPPPKTAPLDVTFTDFNEQPFTLQSLTGDTIVLHFWATWCPPCVDELPALLERAGNEKNMTFVIVTVDTDLQKAQNFLNSYTYLYEKNPQVIMATDPGGDMSDAIFGVNRYPETLILNADKSIREHLSGPADWTTYSLAP